MIVLADEYFGMQRLPVIASSGAGCAEHFFEVFEKTPAEAALTAGIFHRKEVPIGKLEIRPV